MLYALSLWTTTLGLSVKHCNETKGIMRGHVCPMVTFLVGKELPFLLAICSVCDCLVVFVCISLWC